MYDYPRVAYVEARDNETAATLAGFWTRAQDWFWSNDMAVDTIMTDNGPNSCSALFAELLARWRIAHLRTRAYEIRARNSEQHTIGGGLTIEMHMGVARIVVCNSDGAGFRRCRAG